MIESVLVANRGEIARRVIRTARRLGIRVVAVYSEADAALPYVREADEAVPIGPAAPASSYLDVRAVLGAARATGVAAIHPGYGFLSESAEFAAAVIDAGLTWIGPPPAAIQQMGDKINARNLMEQAGVPVAAGTREPVVVFKRQTDFPLKCGETLGKDSRMRLVFQETAISIPFFGRKPGILRL